MKSNEAIEHFDKAISIEPNYGAHGNRGNTKANWVILMKQ